MKCSLQCYHGYVVFLLPCFTSKAIEFTELKSEEQYFYQKAVRANLSARLCEPPLRDYGRLVSG